MCNISADTVIKANARTMSQMRDKGSVSGSVASDGTICVSTSAHGRKYSQRINIDEVKESFRKAIEDYAKKI